MNARQTSELFKRDYKKTLQKYRKLAALWRKLIALDDKDWTSENWKTYVNRWDKIKDEAKQQLEQSTNIKMLKRMRGSIVFKNKKEKQMLLADIRKGRGMFRRLRHSRGKRMTVLFDNR